VVREVASSPVEVHLVGHPSLSIRRPLSGVMGTHRQFAAFT